MKHGIAAAGLIAIGSIQMLGDLCAQPQIKAIGAVTHASPAPKVFTAQNGFETFSARFFIEWRDTSGQPHTLELTPSTYRRLQGPYNRRNAYGAALSYGPVLAANPRTRPMLDLVMDHAFCGDAPLLGELGIQKDDIVYPLIVRLEPRQADYDTARWQTTFPVECAERTSHE